MTPFDTSEASRSLIPQYPTPELTKTALLALSARERVAFARLWCSEGIPWAFREHPLVYEALRDWLAGRLSIHPKSISVAGSARLGFSLAPRRWGQPFRPASDLDVFIVSEPLFLSLHVDATRWLAAYRDGVEKPRNEAEAGHWRENARLLPQTAVRGFLDSRKLPNRSQLITTTRLAQSAYLLVGKLAVTTGAPKVAKASFRVYRSWQAFERQISGSLASAVMDRRGR